MDLTSSPSEIEIVIRLLVSLIIGLAIGLEREIQHKTAGLRTTVLICLGSTIFTLASLEFNAVGVMADPSRIAAQIVTGIGFLGAGAIIQTRASVHGLTTAATIWVMASLGLAVGLGAYVLAVGGAVLAVIALQPLQVMERALKGKKSTFLYNVTLSDCGPAFNRIMAAIQNSPSEVKRVKSVKTDDNRQLVTFEYADRDEAHSRLMKDLALTPGVDEVTTTKQ
jgi:putative Mg2+ transporter-C (MgtC) family protein